jgi:HAE1 family hydrophobic/amphiphilic exporter-1
MNFLIRFSLKNPIAIIILSIMLFVVGVLSFSGLKVDLLPNIEFPQVTVQGIYPGASPQDVNEKVTVPLEKKLKELQNVSKLTSQSMESVSFISIEFPLGTNMDDVSQKLNELIKETPLPDEVTVEQQRFSFGAFPILNLALFGKGDTNINELVENELKPTLERIPGIGSIAVGGTYTEMLEITVDKEKAAEYGVTLNAIKTKLDSLYFSFPAGSVEQNKMVIPVRIEEKIEKLDDLKEITFERAGAPVSSGPPAFSGMNFAMSGGMGGAPMPVPAAPSVPQNISLGELAQFKTITDKDQLIRYNLKEAVAVTVTKKQDANTVEVADKVFAALDQYKEEMDYKLVFDQSEGIKKSVNSLLKEGLFGALFASLAVLLFLRRWLATIIAILSIPLSLMVASILLARYGITLNIMTLGGMAVAVGRVVDDSIVVIENIYRRFAASDGKMSRSELTADATKEMLSAIVSSTVTTTVVFLPLGLVGGITGEFFLPFALTIVFALFASLLVSITIVPVLAQFAFRRFKAEDKTSRIQEAYGRLISWSLKRKILVLSLSFVLLIASFGLAPLLGFAFIPNEEQRLLIVAAEMPTSTTLEKMNEMSLDVENKMGDRATVENVFASIGARDFAMGVRRTNLAQYFVELKDSADPKTEVTKLQTELETMMAKKYPDGTVNVQEAPSGGPPSNNNIDVNLYATDTESLAKAATMVEELMVANDKLKYVSNNLQEKQKQFVVRIDPLKANELGVSGFAVLGVIGDQTRAVNGGTLTLDGKETSIQLAYDESLAGKEKIASMQVFGKAGPIALSEVASIEEIEAVTTIQKLDGKSYAQVTAQVNDSNTRVVSSEVIAAVNNLELPEGVSLNAGSGSEETIQTFIDLLVAMAVAIGLVYIVMLITFGKARTPFVILSSLLFIPVGALLGLFITSEPLSLSAMIGVLMLIGIVVTNAIVYVDRVGQNRNNGMALEESLVEAGKTRLRPILMTAFATICALLPLAFTASEGNLISKGLAVVVIGGLTTSTLLTLVIVPIFYSIFFRKERKQQA